MLQHEIHVQHIKIPAVETNNLKSRIDSCYLQTAEDFHVKWNILFYFHQEALQTMGEKQKCDDIVVQGIISLWVT